MSNPKDTITNVCSFILVLTGVVLALNQAGIAVPQWVNNTATVVAVLATSLIGYFTGKKPNGETKSVADVIATNNDLNKPGK